jgi:hypothetical protein
MNNNFRMEEYYPGGSFLKASFERDRVELSGRFSEFTAPYLAGFIAKLGEVKVLEQSVILTEDQKDSTKELYAEAAELNGELNFLSFYFKRAGLESTLVSAVKKDLAKGNIEGATDKLEGIIQYVIAKQGLLTAKGMAAGFPAELAATRDALNAKNELQNEKINVLKTLHSDNKLIYAALFVYISTISEAGKIMYKGNGKASEYTISRLISRMRSGNSGGGIPLPTA